MEQLNSQKEDVRSENTDIGQNKQANPPNNKYLDMRAAPQQSHRKVGFADITRNKYTSPELLEKLRRENKRPTEVYHQKIRLESYKSDYVVFKNFLLDAKSLAQKATENCSGLLTVREYSQRLSNNKIIN